MRPLCYKEIAKYSYDLPNILVPNYGFDTNDLIKEYYWHWKNSMIHLDYYQNEKSIAKIILLHGIGGNGRILSPIAMALWMSGFEIICPDLLHHGLTIVDDEKNEYVDCINCINDLIKNEIRLDKKPIFLMGIGTGGMMCYNIATMNKCLMGIMITSLIDNRILKKLMVGGSKNKLFGLSNYHIKKICQYAPNLYLVPNSIEQIDRIVKDPCLIRILMEDEYSFGRPLPLKFYTSFITTESMIEPDCFFGYPICLLYPERDRCKPFYLSKLFYDTLTANKVIVFIKDAQHYPIEEPGLTNLISETLVFIFSTLESNVANRSKYYCTQGRVNT